MPPSSPVPLPRSRPLTAPEQAYCRAVSRYVRAMARGDTAEADQVMQSLSAIVLSAEAAGIPIAVDLCTQVAEAYGIATPGAPGALPPASRDPWVATGLVALAVSLAWAAA